MLNPFLDRFIYTNGLQFRDHQFWLLNTPMAFVPMDLWIAVATIPDAAQNRRLYYSVKRQIETQMVDRFALSSAIQLNAQFLAEFFSSWGWGDFEVVHLDKLNRRAIVVVEQNPVGKALLGKSSAAVDHVLRGLLAGTFSYIFKDRIDCVEHQCMAQNAKNCEFILKPSHEFDPTVPETIQQLEME
jgi:predicted hydrocarbon binding protein